MQIPLILDNKITLSLLIAATATDFLTPPLPEYSSLQVSSRKDRDRLRSKNWHCTVGRGLDNQGDVKLSIRHTSVLNQVFILYIFIDRGTVRCRLVQMYVQKAEIGIVAKLFLKSTSHKKRPLTVLPKLKVHQIVTTLSQEALITFPDAHKPSGVPLRGRIPRFGCP